MGTNYYYYEKPPCPTCGLGNKRRHIGKSSPGWTFGLRVYPGYQDTTETGLFVESIKTLEDWIVLFSREGSEIRDEYNERVPAAFIIETITNRSWTESPDYPRTAKWWQQNEAEPGPNGLARRRIGEYCCGHGEGTWDYIEQAFS